jgi:undecaprenyl-diphosphatase
VSSPPVAASRRAELALRLGVGAAVLIAAAWLFGAIAEDVVTSDRLTVLDVEVARWLRAHATPELTRWMLLVTDLHSTIAVSCYAAIVAAALAWRRQWRHLATVFVCVAGGLTLNVLMKLAFHRARPVLDDPLLTLTSYSFPSGHVAGSTLMYGLIVAWTFTRTRRPLVRARRPRRGRRDRARRVHAHVPGRPLPERRRRRVRRRRRLAGALPSAR